MRADNLERHEGDSMMSGATNMPMPYPTPIKSASRKPQVSAALCVLAVCLVILYFASPDLIPQVNKLLGLAILAACSVPSIVYLTKLRDPAGTVEPLPLLPILGLIFGIYYGLPALVQEFPRATLLIPLTYDALIEPLELALFGWIALLTSFYVFSEPLTRVLKPLQLNWEMGRAERLAVVLILLGLGVQVFGVAALFPSQYSAVWGLVSSFFDLGLGIWVLLDARAVLTAMQHRILWFVLVPYYLFQTLSYGLVSGLIYASAFVLLLYWAGHFRMPWRWLIAISLVAIVLRPQANQFRQLAWYGPYAKVSPPERALLFLSLGWNSVQDQGLDAYSSALQDLQQRTAQLNLLAHVVETTPTLIPFWDGYSYYALPTTWIPRVLWPDKPEKTLGQEFGHRYGILDSSDTSTSANFPQVVEMYANFGSIGVIVGMGILGFLYRILYRILNQPGSSDAVLLIAAFLFKNLINIESDFSLVFGGALQQIAVLYFVLRFAAPTAMVHSRNDS